MKYSLLIFSWLILLALQTFAQHCPFDGGNMVAVYVTDKNAKPLTDAPNDLKLVEVDNPVANSCSYAEGLLAKPFLTTKQALQKNYERYWESWIEPEYKNWKLLGNGYYAIILNQAEENCMIKKDGDFIYRKRKYEIQYQNNGTIQKLKVPEDKIYSLCTEAKWTRIVPLEIKITSH